MYLYTKYIRERVLQFIGLRARVYTVHLHYTYQYMYTFYLSLIG